MDIKKFDGADGETRTRTTFVTAPSRQRVYQFHHVGVAGMPEHSQKTRYFGMAPDLSAGTAGAGAGIGATGWAGIAKGLLDSCFWLEK